MTSLAYTLHLHSGNTKLVLRAILQNNLKYHESHNYTEGIGGRRGRVGWWDREVELGGGLHCALWKDLLRLQSRDQG